MRKVATKTLRAQHKLQTLQFLMLHQTTALGIVFKLLSIFWGFFFSAFQFQRVDNPHEMFHMAHGKKKENSFNIKAFWLQKVSNLFLWYGNKLTHEKN